MHNDLYSLYKKIAFWVAVVGFIFFFATAGYGAPAHDFYYFNPDSLQSNLAHLKAEMDGALNEVGFPVVFQPFAHLIDFDRKIREKKPTFLLLPDWYLKNHGNRLKLKPFLVPARNNLSTYRKILLINKHSAITFQNLGNRTLAMTTMGPSGEAILNRALFARRGIDVHQLNIVTVPKDSDALFALSLGQVDMALVTEQLVEQINKLNSGILKPLTTLDETHPLPMPVFCYIEGSVSVEELQKIKEIFLEMGRRKNDYKVMEMLQIDEWKATN